MPSREPNPPSTRDTSPIANPPFPRRTHPTHGILPTRDGPTVIFLTVCTRRRGRWLDNPHARQLLRTIWSEAIFWLVGRYVIMPDHIHLIAFPSEPDYDFDTWVKYWKRLFTQRFGIPEFRWQTDHWDTRMRSQRHYCERWEYVFHNPVRHGLVRAPEEWPFAGEVHELRW